MNSRRALIEKVTAFPKKSALNFRIRELRNIISECQDEIKTLQTLCLHEQYDVVYYSWRIGSMELRRTCSYCNELLVEHPSISEQEDYYSKHGNVLNRTTH